MSSKIAWPNELKFWICLFETIRNQFMLQYLSVIVHKFLNKVYIKNKHYEIISLKVYQL